EPIARRIEFLPGVAAGATFRYTCEGWGLVQLLYGGLFGPHELRRSHTNHSTQKRAATLAATIPPLATIPGLGSPFAWDWPMVTSASGKLTRAIRRLAVDKVSSRPVLPHAAQFIARAGLRYEWGTGIHATPSFGMIGRRP